MHRRSSHHGNESRNAEEHTESNQPLASPLLTHLSNAIDAQKIHSGQAYADDVTHHVVVDHDSVIRQDAALQCYPHCKERHEIDAEPSVIGAPMHSNPQAISANEKAYRQSLDATYRYREIFLTVIGNRTLCGLPHDALG